MVSRLKTHGFERHGGEDIEGGMREQLGGDGKRERGEGRASEI